jgi:hypothetical protein
MTDKKRDKVKDLFIEALKNSAGNISVACRNVNISRNAFYEWQKEDEIFQEKVNEVQESLIDLVESKLMSNIADGKTAEIIFFLKTRAKHRGYVERTEMTGPNGLPMSQAFEINVVNQETKNEILKLSNKG